MRAWLWKYDFILIKTSSAERGTEQLLLRFSEPNQRFISLNPLSIRIPTNSSLCWLVTTTRERERICIESHNNAKKIKEMILITAGWGQICPDRSDMFWHISWYLAAASLTSQCSALLCFEMTWTRPSPVIFHHQSSVFLSPSNYFLELGLGLSFLLAKFWYPRSSVKYLPRTGHIHLIPLSPSPC